MPLIKRTFSHLSVHQQSLHHCPVNQGVAPPNLIKPPQLSFHT